ncbi:MAG: hypothetical protein Q8P53_00880 [Candidatus Shapirobacteria bacterium]|nr:hypothetical protein [Candidatus Shapirobacteria bacterium]
MFLEVETMLKKMISVFLILGLVFITRSVPVFAGGTSDNPGSYYVAPVSIILTSNGNASLNANVLLPYGTMAEMGDEVYYSTINSFDIPMKALDSLKVFDPVSMVVTRVTYSGVNTPASFVSIPIVKINVPYNYQAWKMTYIDIKCNEDYTSCTGGWSITRYLGGNIYKLTLERGSTLIIQPTDDILNNRLLPPILAQIG